MARILLLDDDAPTRSVLSVMLQSLGHDPVEVGCVAEAEAEVESRPVDLILVDLDRDSEAPGVRRFLDAHPELPCIASEDGACGATGRTVKDPLNLGQLFESVEDALDGIDRGDS